VRESLRDLQRGAAVGEPLRAELAGRWRIRVGSLRIVYRVSDATLLIVAVGPRRTIYTELERESRGRE